MVAATTRPAWQPLLVGDPWSVVYNGYGSVATRIDGATLSPRPPAGPQGSDTHAALVVTRQRYGDLAITAQVRTERQLRPGTPNPWEVGWLLWHETDPQHFYAITLKPNGWELSKQVPGAPGGQNFLASGSEPRFSTGAWHELTVSQRGGRITITADGHPLAEYTDRDPYTSGAVGLYTEDAVADFRNVSVTTDGA